MVVVFGLSAGSAQAGVAIASDRSITGIGNNLDNPDWGAAETNFIRYTFSDYGDGISEFAGQDRPNPRLVSNAVVAQDSVTINDRGLSDFVWQWGQFIDHDIALAIQNTGEDASIFAEPGDIIAPVIPTVRSAFDPNTGTDTANPREQINFNTSYIDASMVYGSDQARADALRTMSGGMLKTSDDNLLPRGITGHLNFNDSMIFADEELFLGGDARANEQPGLFAMHTVMVREHNRMAAEFAAANPSLTDEELYQKSRKWLGAKIQVVTYKEFLPALLGPYAPGMIGPGYNPTIDASIANEIAGALYRIGHTMISSDILQLNDDGTVARDPLALRDGFFNLDVFDSSEEVEWIVKGLASKPMQEIDAHIVDELRNFLFSTPGHGGLDLAAMNIQRARDHGLPSYNDVREALGLDRMETFDEISSNPEVAEALASVYTDIDMIDLWVGAISEDHLEGASVGELMALALALQFENLRDGDRFYFLYDGSFSQDEIDLLMGTTLSQMLMDNTGLTSLQPNVFMAIPETATVIQVFALVLVGFAASRLRRRR